MKNRKRLITTGCLLMVLLSVLALSMILFFGMPIYGKFDEWRHQTPTEFSERKWKSSDKYRWVSVELLINELSQQKLNKEELVQRLGHPDSKTAEGHWEYEAKRPGWSFIDFSGGGLLLKFDSDNYLESATNSTWID